MPPLTVTNGSTRVNDCAEAMQLAVKPVSAVAVTCVGAALAEAVTFAVLELAFVLAAAPDELANAVEQPIFPLTRVPASIRPLFSSHI